MIGTIYILSAGARSILTEVMYANKFTKANDYIDAI